MRKTGKTIISLFLIFGMLLTFMPGIACVEAESTSPEFQISSRSNARVSFRTSEG